MTEKLEALLAAIASKMNVTAERAFEILVQGNYAYGMANLVSLAVASLLLVAILTVAFKKMSRILVTKADDDIVPFFGCCLSTFLAFIMFFVAWFQIHNSIMALTAPEYLALKEVLNAVK